MKAHVQNIIFFIATLSIAFACSNKDVQIDRDGNSPDPKKLCVSFHLEDSTNYEARMAKMDSLSVDIQKKLCGSKWLLKDFTPRGNDYLTEKVKELDSLVFMFSPQGDVIIDRIGIIGEWSLSFGAVNDTAIASFLDFSTWNEDIRKTFFFRESYRFAFIGEGRILIVRNLSSEKGKSVRCLFTFFP